MSLNVSYTYRLAQIGDCQPVLRSPLSSWQLSPAQTSLLLRGLEPWRTYQYKLKAPLTYFREEDIVTGVFSTRPSGVPASSVQDVQLHNVTCRRADVSWREPACVQRNGPLRRFDVQLTGPRAHMVLNAYTALYVTLSNLQPSTSYMVRVRYVNIVGASRFTPALNFTTATGLQSRRARNLQAMGGEGDEGEGKEPIALEHQKKEEGGISSGSDTDEPTQSRLISAPSQFPSSEDTSEEEDRDPEKPEERAVETEEATSGGAGGATYSRLVSGPEQFLSMGQQTGGSNSSASSPPAVVPAYLGGARPSRSTCGTRGRPCAPYDLKQVDRDLHCVQITWKINDVLGDIIAYDVFDLTEQGDVNFLGTPKTSPPAGVQLVKLCDLDPGQYYMYGIRSRSRENNVSLVATLRVHTDHAAPPKPYRPVLNGLAMYTIQIDISGVSSMNGPVTSYYVIVGAVPLSDEEKVETGIASSPEGYWGGEPVVGPKPFLAAPGTLTQQLKEGDERPMMGRDQLKSNIKSPTLTPSGGVGNVPFPGAQKEPGFPGTDEGGEERGGDPNFVKGRVGPSAGAQLENRVKNSAGRSKAPAGSGPDSTGSRANGFVPAGEEEPPLSERVHGSRMKSTDIGPVKGRGEAGIKFQRGEQQQTKVKPGQDVQTTGQPGEQQQTKVKPGQDVQTTGKSAPRKDGKKPQRTKIVQNEHRKKEQAAEKPKLRPRLVLPPRDQNRESKEEKTTEKASVPFLIVRRVVGPPNYQVQDSWTNERENLPTKTRSGVYDTPPEDTPPEDKPSRPKLSGSMGTLKRSWNEGRGSGQISVEPTIILTKSGLSQSNSGTFGSSSLTEEEKKSPLTTHNKPEFKLRTTAIRNQNQGILKTTLKKTGALPSWAEISPRTNLKKTVMSFTKTGTAQNTPNNVDGSVDVERVGNAGNTPDRENVANTGNFTDISAKLSGSKNAVDTGNLAETRIQRTQVRDQMSQPSAKLAISTLSVQTSDVVGSARETTESSIKNEESLRENSAGVGHTVDVSSSAESVSKDMVARAADSGNVADSVPERKVSAIKSHFTEGISPTRTSVNVASAKNSFANTVSSTESNEEHKAPASASDNNESNGKGEIPAVVANDNGSKTAQEAVTIVTNITKSGTESPASLQTTSRDGTNTKSEILAEAEGVSRSALEVKLPGKVTPVRNSSTQGGTPTKSTNFSQDNTEHGTPTNSGNVDETSTELRTRSQATKSSQAEFKTPSRTININDSNTQLETPVKTAELATHGRRDRGRQMVNETALKDQAELPEMREEEGPGRKRKRRRRASALPPGQIVAELTPGMLLVGRKQGFVVGDGNTYNGFHNSPLNPEGRYRIYLVANSEVETVRFSVSEPLTVSMPLEPSVARSAVNKRRDNYIVMGVMIGLAVLFIAILIWLKCLEYQYNTPSSPCRCCRFAVPERFFTFDDTWGQPMSVAYPDSMSQIRLLGDQQFLTDERHWTETYSLSEPRSILTGRELLPPSQAVVPAPNPDRPVGSEPINFRKEFQSLPRPNPATSTQAGRRHRDLNNTPSILPYDATRVILEHDGSGGGDYINASYVTGYMDDNGRRSSYIAAQCPFDEGTVVDMWRMIYQHAAPTVVLLSKVIEEGSLCCMQFWPEMGKTERGPFVVQAVDQFTYAHYTEMLVSVKKRKRKNEELLVRLFCFSSWPEKVVPQDAIPLVELCTRVHKSHGNNLSPIVVQCQTGSGRTAVFIALDILLAQYATENQASVYDVVCAMRSERPCMVQTFPQYAFIYEAVLEEMHAGDTWVGEDLRERYKELSRRNPNTGHTFLKDQFILMELMLFWPGVSSAVTDSSPRTGIPLAGNVPDVIPAKRLAFSLSPDRNFSSNVDQRPLEGHDELEDEDSLVGLENAIFVDGYRRKNQFIMAQTPLPSNISDFWLLVYQNDVRSIVAMEEPDPGLAAGLSKGEYWPACGSRQWDPFVVELLETASENNITVRTLRLVHTHRTRDEPRMVRQYQFHGWTSPDPALTRPFRRSSMGQPPSHNGLMQSESHQSGVGLGQRRRSQCCPPPSTKLTLISLYNMVKQWQNQVSVDSSPVLVHCRDGALCSGLYVALSLVAARLDEENLVSVYRVCRALRKRSATALSHFEQYKFLYKALWDYINLPPTQGPEQERVWLPLESPELECRGPQRRERPERVDYVRGSREVYLPDNVYGVMERDTFPAEPQENDYYTFQTVELTETEEEQTEDSATKVTDYYSISTRPGPGRTVPPTRGVPTPSLSSNEEVYRYTPRSLHSSLPHRPPRQEQGSRGYPSPSPQRGRYASSSDRELPVARATPPRTPTRNIHRPGTALQSRTPSPAPRRHRHHSRSPVSRETSPRQRRRDSGGGQRSRSRTPIPVMERGGEGASPGRVRSQSVLEETTEMSDGRGVFYRQEIVDTVQELSTSTQSSDF